MERRLVKRVYEEKADCSKDDNFRAKEVIQRFEEHKARLKEAGIWAVEDQFKNKGPRVNSDGYPLKMLRKHPVDGFYMVHEIKDFSTVIQFLPELECTFRIYCKDGSVKKAKNLLPA